MGVPNHRLDRWSSYIQISTQIFLGAECFINDIMLVLDGYSLHDF